MVAQADPVLTSSHSTPNLQLYIEQLSLKKTWKLAEELLHNKRSKGHIETGRRGRDTGLPQTPILAWGPMSGRYCIDMAWGTRSLSPHQVPQSLGPAPKRGAPKTSGFENQWGLCVGNPKGHRKLTLHCQRAYTQTRSSQDPAQKQQIENISIS